MADQLDPQHLVALMCYRCNEGQDGSSHSLEKSINREYRIRNESEKNLQLMPVLDVIASTWAVQKGHQVMAVALQFNAEQREVWLLIAENQWVHRCVVDHLHSVWSKLQALGKKFAKRGHSNKNRMDSPDISNDVGLSLQTTIFREIYQFTIEKSKINELNWLDNLHCFANVLAKCRKQPLAGIELDLYELVIGLCS